MQHKGYIGTVEIDSDANLLHGSILGVRDVVTFEGRTPSEAEKAFRESVDDYLNFCKERGEEPDKPYSGKFVVRVEPKVHRLISAMAESSGMSLNAWINDRLARDIPAAAEAIPPKRRSRSTEDFHALPRGDRTGFRAAVKVKQKCPKKAS